jgi:hypothetical protein
MQLIGILVLALVPVGISLWGVHRSGRRYRAHLQHIRQTPVRPVAAYASPAVGLIIGDISCRYNARSPYLRCTVNPLGPCKTCRDYLATP